SLKLLIGAGCDLRTVDGDWNSCLTEMYCKNYMEVAKLLVQAGADVNHMPVYNLDPAARRSPLESALFHQRFDLADYLLSAGADIHVRTGQGYRLADWFREVN